MAKLKTGAVTLVPRGLSRTSAAAYIGVSTTFFDLLVWDGRMPLPKQINKRRVWDRWAIDAAFDALEDEESIAIERVAFNDAFSGGPADDDLGKRYKAELGYDPRGMSKDELAAAEENRHREWREWLATQPLDKRETLAMTVLFEHRDRMVEYDEIKGAGIATEEKLQARGYVTLFRSADRAVGWQITAEGVAAWLSHLRAEPHP